MTCVDAFSARRRKPAEEHLPRLLDDIRAIADGQSQADPKFQTNRLFTRISAAEVRRQLIATKGYTDERVAHPADDQHQAQPAGLPAHPGGQVPPPKKVKQTDAIFEQLKPGQPRGRSGHGHAADLDRRQGDGQCRPVLPPGQEPHQDQGGGPRLQARGDADPLRHLPARARRPWLYMARSKVTSDFIVDRLEQWWEGIRLRFLGVKTLVINLDNGPENHSRRTQFLKRIVAVRPQVPADGRSWRTTRRTTASTTRSSGAGASWRCTGTGRCWTQRGGVGLRPVDDLEGKHPSVSRVEQTYARGVRLSRRR